VLLGLLALSVLHFGTADDVTARWLGRSRPAPPATARVLALGGIPVALPLGLHGGAVAELLDALTGGDGDVVRDAARLAVPVVLAAAAVVVVDALAHRHGPAALEPVALLALFAVATPLLAFAVYFGLWHSWRQVARMVAADAHREGTTAAAALRALVRAAALPTALTVAVAVVAVVATRGDAGAGLALLTVALVGVLCLTVPHALVVARTDQHLVVGEPAGGSPRAARP
jgi:Brp/Blh family beta-carotene 15,15'-monooxygenase